MGNRETLMSLQPSSKNISIHDGGECFLSVYTGGLTPPALVEQTTRVLQAFPSLPNSFADLLIERVKDKGFSDDRLRDAVNHVIDTCPYPTPTLANFLSFDKRIKILTYNELVSFVTKGEASFQDYAKIKITGRLHYVKLSDKKLFNLPDEL